MRGNHQINGMQMTNATRFIAVLSEMMLRRELQCHKVIKFFDVGFINESQTTLA